MSAAVEQALRGALGPAPQLLEPGAERPLVDLELPLGLDRLVTRKRLAGFTHAAVMVPILRRAQGLQVLFTRRADHLRAHRGQVSFPGGRYEPDDGQLVNTALRETEEEIGLSREHVEVIGCLDDYPTITRYLVTPVVALIDTPPDLYADHGEVAEIFEIPLAHLLQRSSYQRRFFTREGLRVPFFQIEYDGYVVWGATAGMLWNMYNKMTA
ncbi:MAG: CoA pyrophosphatase [Algiphilus sp.]